MEVPVIDISSFWRQSSPEKKQAIVDQVRDACTRVGFFVVIGHPVPETVIQDLLSVSHDFYDLPLEKKLEYMAKKERAVYTGYVGGRGCPKYKGGPVKGSQDDSGKDMGGPRGEAAVSKDGDLRETYRINRYPAGLAANIFPDDKLPTFRLAYLAYYHHLEQLLFILLRIFALALSLHEEHFLPLFANHSTNLMSAKYFKSADALGIQRKGAHTDAGAMTILLQDHSPGFRAPGLQVLSTTDKWMDVPVIPNAFVINIGDMMMRWTNDTFLSSMHQVVNVNMDHDRHSVMFFSNPNPDLVIECLETCKGPAGPKYGPIVSQEYFEEKMRKTYL